MTEASDGIPMTTAKARDLWAELRRCVDASPDVALCTAFSRCEPLFDMLQHQMNLVALGKGECHEG